MINFARYRRRLRIQLVLTAFLIITTTITLIRFIVWAITE